jgi:hypothetical protein
MTSRARKLLLLPTAHVGQWSKLKKKHTFEAARSVSVNNRGGPQMVTTTTHVTCLRLGCDGQPGLMLAGISATDVFLICSDLTSFRHFGPGCTALGGGVLACLST